MGTIGAGFGGFFEKLGSIFSTYNIIGDTLDIVLLTFMVYYLIKLIRDSRALTFAKGIILFAIVYLFVILLDMQASAFIFNKIFESFLLIVVVIFAPEIRKILEKMGNTKTLSSIMSIFGRGSAGTTSYNEEIKKAVNEICRAASDMSDKKIGALMIFEKKTPLGEIINTGTVLDAEITSELVGNVFFPKAPLHDGAAVFRAGKLYAAGCILPLTSKNDISSELGTRHRAAIGMSEQSDAMVVVVSEETGAISVALGGVLNRGISDGQLRELLLDFLQKPVENKKSKKKEDKEDSKKIEDNGGNKNDQ